MKVQDPRVSVIIPVYDGELYLSEAIESALSQTYRSLEVLVVDDGSTDRSAEVARRWLPRIQYFHLPHCGTGAARNHGATEARGEFLAHLDADDVWVRDKLERQMRLFEAEPELDLVSGGVENFYSPDVEGEVRKFTRHVTGVIGGNAASAIVVRKEAFRRVGAYATEWRLGTDLDWHIRSVELGLRMKAVDGLVVRRRLHMTNSGVVRRQFAGDRLHILKKALDRRRGRV